MIAFLCLQYDLCPTHRARYSLIENSNSGRGKRDHSPKCIAYERLSLTFFIYSHRYIFYLPINCPPCEPPPTHSHSRIICSRCSYMHSYPILCVYFYRYTYFSLAFVSRSLYSQLPIFILCPAYTTKIV